MFVLNTDFEVKKYWFKLCDKDLFRFKSIDSTKYDDMCNLSGVFVYEGVPLDIRGCTYYCINIYNIKGKTIRYYINNKRDYINWLNALNQNTSKTNILEEYHLGVNYCFKLGFN